MPPREDEKFFFIHIMKTGGTSFASIINDNFAPEHRYPYNMENMGFFEHMESYVNVPKFIRNVNENCENLKIVRAHVPFATREFLSGNYRTLTLLRDPVERTISYLKHCRRYHIEHQTMTLEEIYNDTWFRATFMLNYQTKIFSMTAEESMAETRLKDQYPTMPPRKEVGLEGDFNAELAAFKEQAPGRFCLELFAPSTGVITVDDTRLERAKKSLKEIDVVGVTSRFNDFLTRLSHQFQWDVRQYPMEHVGEKDDISLDLRRRIEMETAYDRELFRYADSIA